MRHPSLGHKAHAHTCLTQDVKPAATAIASHSLRVPGHHVYARRILCLVQACAVPSVDAKLQQNIMSWPPPLPCSNNNATPACVCMCWGCQHQNLFSDSAIEFDWNAFGTALKTTLLGLFRSIVIIIIITIINMLMPAPMIV
jgi:hypothetical protein